MSALIIILWKTIMNLVTISMLQFQNFSLEHSYVIYYGHNGVYIWKVSTFFFFFREDTLLNLFFWRRILCLIDY